MDSTSAAPWEQQCRAPVRGHGVEDGGGAAGPSTVKGKTEMVKLFKEMKCFSVVMCVPFGRPTSRWQRPGRHNWAVMGELTFLYI